MTQRTNAWTMAVAVLAGTGTIAAHHSLAQFDTTTPRWIKGTIVRFDPITPHARFHLDQTGDDGRTERWLVDGPAANNLERMRIGPDFLKPGDVVEVCGFILKAGVASQQPAAGTTPAALPGRPFSGHLLVMPDGTRRYWADYGVLEKCLEPGEDKETLRREAFGR